MYSLDDLKQVIEAAIENAEVHILDPRSDGVHLEAIVVSPLFDTLPLFKQHQLVMKALKNHFETGLHALGLKTFTPAAWEAAKRNYL